MCYDFIGAHWKLICLEVKVFNVGSLIVRVGSIEPIRLHREPLRHRQKFRNQSVAGFLINTGFEDGIAFAIGNMGSAVVNGKVGLHYFKYSRGAHLASRRVEDDFVPLRPCRLQNLECQLSYIAVFVEQGVVQVENYEFFFHFGSPYVFLRLFYHNCAAFAINSNKIGDKT